MYVYKRQETPTLHGVSRLARVVAWVAVVVVIGLSLFAMSRPGRRAILKMDANRIISPWDTSAAPPAGDPDEVRVKHTARATVTAETTDGRRRRRHGSGAGSRN